MAKRNKIIYWVATAWLALGMLSTGLVQLFNVKTEVNLTAHLDYPVYFITIVGAWKILGVVAVVIPGFTLVKEWAYAGFFFVMTGALISHLAVSDSLKEIFPPMLLLILTFASWYFRPADRRIVPLTHK